jgi:hypothetical protein
MATNKTVTNTIYKAGSSKEVVAPSVKVTVTAPSTVPASTVRATPGSTTTTPAQVAVTANKGIIYKMGVPPVAGKANY